MISTLVSSINYGPTVVRGDQPVYTDTDGKTYIAPTKVKSSKAGILLEFRLYFDEAKTEPDPLGREGCRLYREELNLKDAIPAEILST